VKRRKIGGVMFECLSAGTWISDDAKIAIVHMMQGTPHEAWELYLTALGDDKIDPDNVPDDLDDTDFLCSQYLCSSIDFGGTALADDVAKLAARLEAES